MGACDDGGHAGNDSLLPAGVCTAFDPRPAWSK
jgi:hypothetical protein